VSLVRQWRDRVPRGVRRAAWLSVALVLLAHPVAVAASDVFSNVGPGASTSGLATRYPLGNYALDQHFSAVDAGVFSGVDVSGVPPLIAYFLADVLSQLTAFLASVLIELFGFAFSLDLVNGSEATGGAGALAPVGNAVRSIYRDVFGSPWLVVALALAGLWAMWKALVQRRYVETAGALAVSLVFVVIALAFVVQPERTIGSASGWSNRMSTAFLSLSDQGSVSNPGAARQAASDQLFSLLVFKPWVVLNFGGLEHCVQAGTGSGDSDPRSVPVRPVAPGRRSATVQEKRCVNNARKYASHFLAYAPDSDDRDAEYEALNSGDAGKLPDSDAAKRSHAYALGVADKPATDAMEKGGQYQRLLMALVVFAAELGAFLLLGALSVAVILAQVMVLVLLAFAPVALVAGAYPGRGHDLFRGWLSRLVAFLLRKAIYSLILAVLLAVLAAVGDASAQLGWLMSFGLQAAFLWAVFLYRHHLSGHLVAATAGAAPSGERPLGRLATIYYARQLVRRRVNRLRRRGRASAHGSAASPGRPADPPEDDRSEPHTTSPAREASATPPRGPVDPTRDVASPETAVSPRTAPRPEQAGQDVEPPDRSEPEPSPLTDDLRRDRERFKSQIAETHPELPIDDDGVRGPRRRPWRRRGGDRS
jgi:TrbL/VirB6 plasmid conjugal transfer protein